MKASNDNQIFDEASFSAEYLHNFLHEVRMGRHQEVTQEVRAAIHALLFFQGCLVEENEMLYARVANLELEIASTAERQILSQGSNVVSFGSWVADSNSCA